MLAHPGCLRGDSLVQHGVGGPDLWQQLPGDGVVETAAVGPRDLEAMGSGEVQALNVDPLDELLDRAAADDGRGVPLAQLTQQLAYALGQPRRSGVGHLGRGQG